MEKELQQKLEEIAFRLQRLTDDYHDLLNELSQMDEVKKSKKVVYEQYKTNIKHPTKYKIQSRINEDTRIINIISKRLMKYFNIKRYYYYDKDDVIYLTERTKIVIESFIPSKNICLVVEL